MKAYVLALCMVLTTSSAELAQTSAPSNEHLYAEIARLREENRRLSEEIARLQEIIAASTTDREHQPANSVAERYVRLKLLSFERTPVSRDEADRLREGAMEQSRADRETREAEVNARIAAARVELDQARKRKSRMLQDNDAARHKPKDRYGNPPKTPHSAKALADADEKINSLQNKIAALNRELSDLRRSDPPATRSPEVLAAVVIAEDANRMRFRVSFTHPDDAFLIPMIPGDWFEARGRVVATLKSVFPGNDVSDFVASYGKRLELLPAD